MILYLADPSGRRCDIIKVEHSRAQDFLKIHISIVAWDDFRFGLQSAYDLLYAFQFLRCYFRSLIEEHDVTEFYLLYYEILNVFLISLGSEQ